MSHWAAPGVQCRCVKADWSAGTPGPSVDDVCTIREVTVTDRGIFLLLVGFSDWIPVAPMRRHRFSYLVDNFRPLKPVRSLTDDLREHFTPLLDAVKYPERVG